MGGPGRDGWCRKQKYGWVLEMVVRLTAKRRNVELCFPWAVVVFGRSVSVRDDEVISVRDVAGNMVWSDTRSNKRRDKTILVHFHLLLHEIYMYGVNGYPEIISMKKVILRISQHRDTLQTVEASAQ